MSNRKKPGVGKVISGTHGYLWWDGDICYEVTSFEAKLKASGETINFAGDMWADRKLMGVEGTWSAKIKKVYSRAKTYAEKLADGEDVRLTLTGKLQDPDNGGVENVTLDSCWLDELPIISFENGKIIEDEFSGGFTGFTYNGYISDPCK